MYASEGSQFRYGFDRLNPTDWTFSECVLAATPAKYAVLMKVAAGVEDLPDPRDPFLGVVYKALVAYTKEEDNEGVLCTALLTCQWLEIADQIRAASADTSKPPQSTLEAFCGFLSLTPPCFTSTTYLALQWWQHEWYLEGEAAPRRIQLALDAVARVSSVKGK
jgi:hypothetical protein